MLHDPMFVDEVNKLIARRPHQRRVGGAAGGAQAQAHVRQHPGRVLPRAPRGRGLRGRPRGAQPDGPGGGRGGRGARRAPSSSRTTCRPADAAMLARSGEVAGFVTDLGGQTSHTAIVARARETPAVVGAGRASEQISPGDLVALDGTRGLVLVNPTRGAAGAVPRDDAAPPRERAAGAADRATCPRSRGRLPGPAQRQHGVHRGDPLAARARRRGHRAVPHRVPLPGPHDAAHRGGALPGLPPGARGDGRAAGHHPHAGPGRRQGAGQGEAREGAQPGDGPAGHPLLPGAPGAVPRPAARAAARQRARQPAGHVPAHLAA